MFDHVGIQVTEVSASAAALAAAFHPIGLVECRRFDTPGGPVVAFADASAPERPYFWLSGGTKTDPRHESHIAFVAGSRAEVDEVGAAAVEAGLEILHEPRLWPEYHEHYYGVFFRDLDGNNFEAVSHRPE